MKKKIALIIGSLITITALQAMEKRPAVRIDVVNDTDYPLRINEDTRKIELAPHERHTIKSEQVKDVSVKYLKSLDLTAVPINIREISGQAQTNDLRVHIVPGLTYGIRVGKIEPFGAISGPKKRVSEEEQKAERVHHGLEESLLSLGTTPAEEEAYRLLGVHPGASGHEIFGLSKDITLANLGPDKYLKMLKDAYNGKNRHLFSIAPAPSPEVKRAYTEIAAKAFHDLGGWPQEAGKVQKK